MSTGPSTQTLSALMTRKGSASIKGSALTRPPPVSSNCLRSSEIMISIPFARFLRCASSCAGEIVDVDHRLFDAGRLQMVEAMIDQGGAADRDQGLRPCRGQRAHTLAEAGGHHHRGRRHRRDRIGTERERFPVAAHAAISSSQGSIANRLRDVGVEPGADRGQRWLRQIPLKQAPHAGLELAVAGLVVPLPEAGEDAENAGVALRGERPVGAFEFRALRRRLHIAVDHRPLDRRGDVAPRILEHRGQIVGRVAGRPRPGSRAGRDGRCRRGRRPA